MANITPYKINVPEDKLKRLRQKLDLADFPDEIDTDEWIHGTPLKDVKRLVEYWKNSFDWRAVEAKLNRLPQFTADVDVGDGFGTLKIHFVHAQSQVKNAIPLLFSHGWPGSFLEVTKILPLLLEGGKDYPAFHIVAPSLPNFGFSQGVTAKDGFSNKYNGLVCHRIMQALGYEQYVTQGGDIGRPVTRSMAYQFPESCRATHLNFVVPFAPNVQTDEDTFFKAQQTPQSGYEKAALARTEWFFKEGRSYALQHATRDQTLSYALTDSPVALLGWIYEKLHDWTDNYPWTEEEVLTWISVYWFSTAGPGASTRIYWQTRHDTTKFDDQANGKNDKVLLGISRFPKEIVQLPNAWALTLGKVVFDRQHDSGGHFAAHEKPEVLVQDLRDMFGKNGGAYACVHGKTGFD